MHKGRAKINTLCFVDDPFLPRAHRAVLREWAKSLPEGWDFAFTSERKENEKPEDWVVEPWVGKRLFAGYHALTRQKKLGRAALLSAYLMPTGSLEELLSAEMKTPAVGDTAQLGQCRILIVDYAHAGYAAMASRLRSRHDNYDAVAEWTDDSLALISPRWIPRLDSACLADLVGFPARPWISLGAPAAKPWASRVKELVREKKLSLDELKQDADEGLLRTFLARSLAAHGDLISSAAQDWGRLERYPELVLSQEKIARVRSWSLKRRQNRYRKMAVKYVEPPLLATLAKRVRKLAKKLNNAWKKARTQVGTFLPVRP